MLNIGVRADQHLGFRHGFCLLQAGANLLKRFDIGDLLDMIEQLSSDHAKFDLQDVGNCLRPSSLPCSIPFFMPTRSAVVNMDILFSSRVCLISSSNSSSAPVHIVRVVTPPTPAAPRHICGSLSLPRRLPSWRSYRLRRLFRDAECGRC